MTRGSTTQLRTFAYDTSMRLQSVTQPENGTTSYTYDSLDRIATKTDAKGQVVTYSYDAYGRILSDGKATYTYDTGTGANLWGRLASVTSSAGVETFSYTQSGLVASKTQAYTAFISPAPKVEYLYDNEGKVTQLTYPQTGVPKAGGGYDPVPRRVLTYSYDSAGRPLKVMEGATEIAGSAQYNAAGQLTAYNANGARSFQYNIRGQMTWVTESGVNVEYRYSPTANDGRVWQRKDWISGEEVTYLYDELGRLSTAATTGPEWGLSWTMDGFGNRLAQNVTKGTAPVVSLTVNPANNRISSTGFVYDANGNQTQWTQGLDTVTAGYDVENRMTSVTSPSYVEVYKYNAANQRLVKDNQFGTQRKHYVYGLGGELLGEYEECSTGGSWYVPCSKKERIYFAGRFVQEEGVWMGTDRLGTVGQTAARAYPYGEANSEFATYRRDTLTGLDYAWNRYYSSTWGRFTSADPYRESGRAANPGSWNRYAYVAGDPVNWNDPSGLMAQPEFYCDPDYEDECVLRVRMPYEAPPGGAPTTVVTPPRPETKQECEDRVKKEVEKRWQGYRNAFGQRVWKAMKMGAMGGAFWGSLGMGGIELPSGWLGLVGGAVIGADAGAFHEIFVETAWMYLVEAKSKDSEYNVDAQVEKQCSKLENPKP